MSAVLKIHRQHLIDPELCARCNSCEENCPRQAITHDFQNYAVDPQLCAECEQCVSTCSTGAIDHWREVTEPYSVAEQLAWQALPAGPGSSRLSANPMTDSLRTDSLSGSRETLPNGAFRPALYLYTLQASATAHIVDNRRITAGSSVSDVHHLVLDFGAAPFPVLEGQSLSVIPPGVDARGHTHHVRVYSIASPRDGELAGTNTVALTVKRVTEDLQGQVVRGVCSNYLCDLEVGAAVRIVGPSGSSFLMPEDPQTPLLMICTGTGIAPMRAMIERRRRLQIANTESMMLFYGARTPQEMPYYQDIRAIAGTAIDANLSFSRSTDHPRQYVQDLLRQRATSVAGVMARGAVLYICGLRNMESGVNDALRDIFAASGVNWDELATDLTRAGRYHVEVY